MNEKQPLSNLVLPQHIEAAKAVLTEVADRGFDIRQTAFNLAEGHGATEDLAILDAHIAQIVLLMPHLRMLFDLKNSPVAEFVPPEDPRLKLDSVNFTVTELANSVVLVPVLGIVAT